MFSLSNSAADILLVAEGQVHGMSRRTEAALHGVFADWQAQIFDAVQRGEMNTASALNDNTFCWARHSTLRHSSTCTTA